MFQKNAVHEALSQIIFRKSHYFIAFWHQIILVLVTAAITVLVFTVVKPGLTGQFSPFFKEEVAPVSNAATVTVAQQASKPTQSKQQQSVTNWLAKRYRVGDDAAHTFVSAAYTTAKDLKLDPLLILSVMAIESGLNPFAESPAGAQGLMQVMSKIHRDKFEEFGGLKVALDPVANIRVGAQILKEYVKRGGSVEAGLKMYVGAALAENDGGYGNKVLAEYKRLKDVSNGKSVPVITKVHAPVAVVTPAVVKVSVKETEIINGETGAQIGESQAEQGLVAAI